MYQTRIKAAKMLSVESYTELTDKLNQVSQRALEMKKESLKLLNKVGTDMNDLISRTQELVQSCLAGRNGFYFFDSNSSSC